MRGTKESVNSSLVQGSSPFICSHYGQRMTLENGVTGDSLKGRTHHLHLESNAFGYNYCDNN